MGKWTTSVELAKDGYNYEIFHSSPGGRQKWTHKPNEPCVVCGNKKWGEFTRKARTTTTKKWKKHGCFPLISIPEVHESGTDRGAFSGKRWRHKHQTKKGAKN